MNPAAANMSPLADIKGVRLLTRKSADAIYAMADGGDLVEGALQWVWNLAVNPQGEIRDLRFWIGEVLSPKKQADLTLAQVINFLVPPQRREFPAGEVQALLLVSRPTLMELRPELLGDLRAGGSFYPRAGLVKFFQQRWLGRPAGPAPGHGKNHSAGTEFRARLRRDLQNSFSPSATATPHADTNKQTIHSATPSIARAARTLP